MLCFHFHPKPSILPSPSLSLRNMDITSAVSIIVIISLTSPTTFSRTMPQCTILYLNILNHILLTYDIIFNFSMTLFLSYLTNPSHLSYQITSNHPGYKTSYFQVLFPSVLLHAMANFRGMKPFYVWKSSRPWDEVLYFTLLYPSLFHVMSEHVMSYHKSHLTMFSHMTSFQAFSVFSSLTWHDICVNISFYQIMRFFI